MSTLYSIHKWSETFLSPKARGRKGRLNFIQLPCRLDDLGYIRVAANRNAAEALGVWLALIELAASLDARDGFLRHGNGRPHTHDEMALVTRLPVKSIDRCVPTLVDAGWLISEQCGTFPNVSEKFGLSERASEKRERAEKREKGSTNPVELGSTDGGRTSSDIDIVVAHYRSLHPRSRPGARERKLIASRLREGYTAADLCEAIDGCHRSPHHCGVNDRRTKYQSLGLIFRDSDHVNQFINMPADPAKLLDERSVKSGLAVEQWLEDTDGRKQQA